MDRTLKIIFLGTPGFAAESRKKLVENQVDVVAVVTAPDKPKGRGKKTGTSAVKDYALETGLPVLQPANLKSPGFIKELAAYQADLQIVVAFRMLPEMVWNMPPLGTFNLHASLLPQYRGAAPINWAIINGEKETGITTFFLTHEIDTGAIVFQEKEPIYDTDNVGSLQERLMKKGAGLVLKTVDAIETGDFPQVPQPDGHEVRSAPRIFKEDCKINWGQDAGTIRDFVRGLSPYPTAWTVLESKSLKVFAVEIVQHNENKPMGMLYSDNKDYIRVQTRNHTLEITELQLEGKKRMKTVVFLRGYNLSR